VVQGVPGRLMPRIFLTFGTTRVVGRQPNAPAASTPEEIPGTHFQRLSRPQGTWFCRWEPRIFDASIWLFYTKRNISCCFFNSKTLFAIDTEIGLPFHASPCTNVSAESAASIFRAGKQRKVFFSRHNILTLLGSGHQ